MIAELLGEVVRPLRGMLVALAGAALAYLWYDEKQVLAVVLAIIVCFIGVIADQAGKALLPARPVGALWLLEGWVLTPAALAAIAAAVVVLVTVALTVPDDTPATTKETIGALSTGITAFVTAAFVSWAGDADNSTVADHVKTAFRAHYNRAGALPQAGVHYFTAASVGEQWVYSDEYGGVEGWGYTARHSRAYGIANELKNGTSDPPGP